jgi:hypothetical protein
MQPVTAFQPRLAPLFCLFPLFPQFQRRLGSCSQFPSLRTVGCVISFLTLVSFEPQSCPAEALASQPNPNYWFDIWFAVVGYMELPQELGAGRSNRCEGGCSSVTDFRHIRTSS